MNIDFWLYKIYVQLSGDVTAQEGRNADFWAAKIYYSIALGNNNVVPMGRSAEFYLGKFYFYLTGNPASTPYQRNINDWLRMIYLRMRYGTSQPLPTFANDRNAEFWARLLFELIESGNYYLLPPTITGNAIPFNVTENSPVDTVVGTLSYTNPNATETPVFTIVSGNTNNTFKINATTGQVSVNIPPDYEQTPSYSLIIRITVQNASAQAAMSINISNTADTYDERVIATSGLIQYLKLNETSGTNANDSSSENNDGTFSGVSLNNAQGNGIGMPLFDGINDFVNLYSAGLAADFNGAEGSVILWIKALNSGVWTDGSQRVLFRAVVDGSNEMYIRKSTVNNTIVFFYRAGGTAVSVTKSDVSSIDLISIGMAWSKSNNRFRAYFNSIQEGSTQSGFGTWVGAPVSTGIVIGANSTGAASPWSGWLSRFALFNRELSAVEMLSLGVYP